MFILFGNLLSPCMVLFEPARLLILKETTSLARLLKPAPFWILLLVFSKKCRNCYQIVAATQVQQPRTNFDKKSLINLMFSTYLLEIHLPCTIIWDTFLRPSDATQPRKKNVNTTSKIISFCCLHLAYQIVSSLSFYFFWSIGLQKERDNSF